MAAEDPNSELGILIGHELMIVKTGGILIFTLDNIGYAENLATLLSGRDRQTELAD